jgi:hypothetical protein
MPCVQHIQDQVIVCYHIMFRDMPIVSFIISCNLVDQKVNYTKKLINKKLDYNQILVDYNHNYKTAKLKYGDNVPN